MIVKFKPRGLQNILEYLFIGLLIIDCFSVYYRLIGYVTLQILNIGITGCLIFISYYKGKKSISLRMMGFISYYTLSCVLLLLISDYAYLGFFSGCMIPLILFCVYFSLENSIDTVKRMLFAFSNIIFAVCCISLFFYFMGSMNGLISPSNTYSATQIGWSDFNYTSYWGIYFEGHKTFFFGRTILRNIGIFLEAPVYAYVISTALFIDIFICSETKKIRIAIFLITAFTTYSTTAIAVCLVLLFFWYYKASEKKSLLKLLIPILVVVVGYAILSVYFDKVSLGNDSGAARTDDFVACLKCFFDNPISGTGFNQVRAIDPYRSAFRRTGLAGMSAGIPFVFANGGILYGLVYLMPFVFGMKKAIKNQLPWRYFGFIAIQFLLLHVIIVEYSLLSQMFLAMSWFFALSSKKDTSLVENRSVALINGKMKHSKSI